MKQVVQSFRTGELSLMDVPPPSLRPQGILVRTAASLVSAGTERMVVEFAGKNLVEKARARPDLVRQVMDKAQREGIVPTVDAVRNRLDQPLPLGYSSAGIVTAVGREVPGFQVGDRVACAGSGFASHAELAYIPRNLAVRLPEGLPFEVAAFGTLGAIALQGVRQAEVTLGHNVAVIGLGLVGQLTVQLLRAAGCRVLGVDIDSRRVDLARSLGANDAVTNEHAPARAMTFTNDHGFDAILITADTRSNEPVALAGELARDRAVVVAVGAVGMEIPRKVYYEKELDFRLSRSYGPGRYDSEYEEKGHDYPYGYVRWTEQRNIEAFLQLAADGKVTVEPLISHRFSIDDATDAYDLITGKAKEPFLGVILTYDATRTLPERIPLPHLPTPQDAMRAPASSVSVGVLGAGNFVNATLLPAMRDLPGLRLRGIASGSGLTAATTGTRFGFEYAAAAPEEMFADSEIDWIAIATRHDLHATQAIASMQAGKNVFVEKPLALDRAQLLDVARTQRQTGRQVIVGFNRRFAPMVRQMKEFLDGRNAPVIATCRVNAGAVPRNHWTQDTATGGGRIIGEACHFIDLLAFLVDSPVTTITATPVQASHGVIDDEVALTLTFEDGSVGIVIYAAGGDKSYSKERIEIIGDGRIAALEDYRHLELVRNGKRSQTRERLRPNKGHRDLWRALVDSTKSGLPGPIPFAGIVNTHLATLAAVESLRTGQVSAVQDAQFWREVNDDEAHPGPGAPVTHNGGED